jgi:high affinity Mn2+ porin
METFYRIQVSENLFISPDYQFVVNPGYNKDRQGPVSIPGIRIHVAI